MKQLTLLAAVLTMATSAAALTIENGSVTNVSRTNGWFTGLVETNSTNASCTLYYGTSDGSTNGSSWGYSNTSISIDSNLSVNVTGLSPATRYYYRWYAVETNQTYWATGTSNFWTIAGVPTGSPPAYTYITVKVDQNGNLAAPTNFWDQNGILRTNSTLWVEHTNNSSAHHSRYTDTESTNAALTAWPNLDLDSSDDLTSESDPLALHRDGSTPLEGDFSGGGHTMSNFTVGANVFAPTPTDPSNVVNKAYADALPGATTNMGTVNATIDLSGTLKTRGNWISGDGGNEGVYVDASGNVGIGTNAISERFQVNGDTRLDYLGLGTAVNANRISAKVTAGGNKEFVQCLGSDDDPSFLIGVDGSENARILMYDGSGVLKAKLNTSGSSSLLGGDLGIGTNTPAAKLHVNGTTKFGGVINTDGNWISGDGGNEGIYVDASGRVGIGQAPLGQFTIKQTADLSSNGVHIIEAGSTDWWDIYLAEQAANVDCFAISRNSGEPHFFIDPQGETGFGTNVPTAKIHIMQSAATDCFLVEDQVSDPTPFVINQSGNVGIGTNAPGRKCEIVDASNSVQLRLSGGGVENSSFEMQTAQSTDVAIEAIAAAAGENRWTIADLAIHVAHTTHNVGIGTNTPATKLHINGPVTITEAAEPSDPADGQMVIWFSNGSGAGDDGDVMFKRTVGGVVTTNKIDFTQI